MKYCFGEDTIHISHIGKNILRCTITRKAAVINESWLIEKDVHGNQHDSNDRQGIKDRK